MVTRNSANTWIVPTVANEVTAPAQPAFLAYLASADNNVTGAGVEYKLGTNVALTEVFDQNDDFNVNGTFTAPVTGRYIIGGLLLVVEIDANMTYGFLNLNTSNRDYKYYLNPANIRCLAAAPYIGSFKLFKIADMDASDTFTVKIRVDGGAGNTADLSPLLARISMSGELVC